METPRFPTVGCHLTVRNRGRGSTAGSDAGDSPGRTWSRRPWRRLRARVPHDATPAFGRSAVERAQKQELVAQLHGVFGAAAVVVVTHYSGLSVAEMSDLRNRMRAAGGSFKVTKNRLTKLALQDTELAAIADLFSGPTAIGYSDDPVVAPKIIATFAKDNEKLIILGGAMGSTVLDSAGVKALAELPSLDELRAKIIGLVSAPATK
ncbi:MAG: 50S ribosomal protein L10, partial [Alphaproteobacteria bacterium]